MSVEKLVHGSCSAAKVEDCLVPSLRIFVFEFTNYNNTSEMQSIGRAKHTVLMVTGSDPMATYHFAIVFIDIK